MTSNQFDHHLDPDPPGLLQGNNPTEITAPTPRVERSQLGVHFKPSDLSVICGRGKVSYNHPGNRRFRALFNMFLEDYSNAVKAGRKIAKSAIVSTVIIIVRQTGGCFCKLEQGVWYEVGDYCAREKVSASFRDMLHAQDRASTKVEINRRNAQGTELPNDSSIVSSPCSGSNTDMSALFRDMLPTHDRPFTTKAVITSQKAQGTGLPDDSSISSSPCSGSETDSLGFDHLLDVGFFDIDSVF
jgi:hypothetical protein